MIISTAGRRRASSKSSSNAAAEEAQSEGTQPQPHSVSKAKMVVNLIKKFTHHGQGGGSSSTNSSSGQSSAKKSGGRLDHELERLNSKIVSCRHTHTLPKPPPPIPSSLERPAPDKRLQGHPSDAETNKCTGFEKSDLILGCIRQGITMPVGLKTIVHPKSPLKACTFICSCI